MLTRIPVALRFWPKVRKGAGCWLWMGATMWGGYGKIWDGERVEGAHRISWVIAHGRIPDGLKVLHTCDNPPCVNPAHLFLGTDADNRRDCVAKGRWWRDAKGEKCGNHKLSNAQVAEIRKRYVTGKGGGTAKGRTSRVPVNGTLFLAREYGVTRTTIQRIVRRKTWFHI